MNSFGQSQGEDTLFSDVIALILRVGVGGSLFYFHSLNAAQMAWGKIWHQKDWKEYNFVADLNIPFPLFAATTGAVIVFVGSITLMAGLLSRLTYISLLIVVLISYAVVSAPGQKETALLYVITCAVGLLMGGGRIGLDPLLNLGRK